MTPELLLSYYGDDLTGSTDVMEALESRGVPTALFLDIPRAEQMARLGPVRAIGIAGTSRSESPAWMAEHLPPVFAWLRGLGAPICHYKVCSTFDSSPAIGSIGKAIDIGAAVFGQATVPLVVGAPQLRRYTVFGHLFAAYAGAVHRIDRHPVMSRHPVTPMREADLRLHLAEQTARSIGLVDLMALAAPDRAARIAAVLADKPGAVLVDVADLATQAAAGEALLAFRGAGNPFVAGSSGVEYALLSVWEATGAVPGTATFPPPGPVERIAVVSGSCSPTTERQIRHALAAGFAGIALDPSALLADEGAIERAVAEGLRRLGEGRSVILHTALGPAGDIGADLDGGAGGRHGLGRALGRIQRDLVARAGLTRAVIAGGDTSSHALRELGIFALRTRLPLPRTPGSPLCTAFSDTAAFDGLQIALKGGQVGNDDYFSCIRAGQAGVVD